MGFSQPTVSLGDFYGSMVVSIWNSSMTFINQLFFSVGQGHVTNTGSISCAKTNNKLFNFSGLESHPFLVKLGIVHEHGFIIFIILHIHLCSWYSYYTSMFMMFILYIYVHDVHIIHLCSYIKCVVFFLAFGSPLGPLALAFFFQDILRESHEVKMRRLWSAKFWRPMPFSGPQCLDGWWFRWRKTCFFDG
jgi:hypothetical protein